MEIQDKINIRPQVNILSVLKRIQYETWYALAEFIDNSISSYLQNKELLEQIEGLAFKLQVSIEINEEQKRIVIRDNAAGIHSNDYARAFRAAEIPPDNTGLSEFGMGMKSAACWFADEWAVTTTALGETTQRKVYFDLQKIFDDKIEELEIDVQTCEANRHYTIIELYNVNKIPQRRGLGKLKEHLSSIYREFLRKGILKLRLNGQDLDFESPAILFAPKYNNLNGEPVLWKKEISFEINEKLSVRGFVALREKGSTSQAGFSLFRRGRVIEGSYENGFRPDFIFGPSNSYRYQRIFGELHLEGFSVNFTKFGIQWDENLDVFLQTLRDDISSDSFPLLQQADNFRSRASDSDYKVATRLLEKTVDNLIEKGPNAIQEVFRKVLTEELIEKEELLKVDNSYHKEFEVRFNHIWWRISIELSYDPSVTELIDIGDSFIKNKTDGLSVREIGIRLSLTHPFMIQFVGSDSKKIEPILHIAASLGLAEIIAYDTYRNQGEVRRNFNELVTHLLSQS